MALTKVQAVFGATEDPLRLEASTTIGDVRRMVGAPDSYFASRTIEGNGTETNLKNDVTVGEADCEIAFAPGHAAKG